MSWAPVVAGNVQNNFIVSWHEINLGKESIKAAKIPVIGNAVEKEDCTVCETTPQTEVESVASAKKATRYAID